jgi:hypothetical protein
MIEADGKGEIIIPKVQPHTTLVQSLQIIQTIPPSFSTRKMTFVKMTQTSK